MHPPIWTHEDEQLWHAYACAALAGHTASWPDAKKAVLVGGAADVADGMLAEHRRRFPRVRALAVLGGDPTGGFATETTRGSTNYEAQAGQSMAGLGPFDVVWVRGDATEEWVRNEVLPRLTLGGVVRAVRRDSTPGQEE